MSRIRALQKFIRTFFIIQKGSLELMMEFYYYRVFILPIENKNFIYVNMLERVLNE